MLLSISYWYPNTAPHEIRADCASLKWQKTTVNPSRGDVNQVASLVLFCRNCGQPSVKAVAGPACCLAVIRKEPSLATVITKVGRDQVNTLWSSGYCMFSNV